MPRLGKGALANFFLRDKQTRCRSADSRTASGKPSAPEPLLDERRDVDNKTGPHVGVEAGVDDLEGPMRLRARYRLFEAGEKTGVVAERSRDGVIGMAASQ